MYRFVPCLLLFVLLLAPARPAPAGTVVDLHSFKGRTVEVHKITPSFQEDGSLALTAETSEPPNPPCRVTWRFAGEAHGYAFRSRQGETAILALGDRRARVTVEACIARGGRIGDCASITLTADLLEEEQDLAAYDLTLPPDLTESDFICRVQDDDRYQFVFYEVASRVNTVTGTYTRDREDLSVKVPGGVLSVHRWYQGGAWRWEHGRHDLTPVRGGDGRIVRILKGTTPYRPVPGEEGAFSEGVYRIVRTEAGYRWESRGGQWKRYNAEGKLTAFGDRTGVIGRILFRDGRPFCLSDRDNRAVLYLDHDESGLLRAAYDREGRGVTYRYRDGRLSAATDVLGRETRFSYDDQGRLAEVLEPEGGTVRIAYHESGRVASVLDGRGAGHTFTWDYDQDASLYYVRIQAPSGKTTEIWSNREGRARRVDVNGRTVHRIEEQGRTLVVTDARGGVTRKTFDDRGNLLEIVHPDGATLLREVEPRFNRVTRRVNENGIETRFSYDDRGNLTRKVEAAGTPSERVTEFTYDGNGNRLSIRRLGDENTEEANTFFSYDASGNRITETDAEGHTTRFTHDTRGNVLTRTDPAGATHAFTYDLAGRPVRTVDPLGHETRFVYDAQGRKTREIDPEGNETRYAYDEAGNLVSRTDALGNSTRFEYNASGRLTRQVDPEGVEMSLAYDEHDRLVSTTDGAGNTTHTEYATLVVPGCTTCGSSSAGTNQPARIVYPTYEKVFSYDARGRKTEETDVLSETEAYTTQFAYDPAGNLVAETDKAGHTTRYAYDALNRRTRKTDPLGNVTRYAYDDRDNLVALTDANGNTTRFAYDRNNRLIKETRPLGEETVYAYDPAGRLHRKTDAKGQRSRYTHDAAGRLVTIQYLEASAPLTPVKTVTFTHDRTGHILSYDDGTTSARYTYDALYRKTEETVDYGPFTKTFTYSYHTNGRKKAFTGPDGIPYTYTYDEAGRLASIQIPGLGPITYTDYQWSRPQRIDYPGGTRRTLTYDPLMRTTRILALAPDGRTIMDYRYTHDPMGNILTKRTEHGDYTYTYDALNQLTGADNPTLPDEAYTYDPVGNRLTSADVPGPWRYNENNELLSYDDVAFRYDANGSTVARLTPSGTSRYVYNEENRLSRVEDEAGHLIARYYYDPFGRRLWKEVDGTKRYFLYSDEGLVGEYEETGEEIRTYGYVPDLVWMIDPVLLKKKNSIYYYQNDHLGTPYKLCSKKGNTVWNVLYSCFGYVVHLSGNIESLLRYPGQYYDYEIQYNYNYYRVYSALTGRYLTKDRINFGMFHGSNNYVYVNVNPLKYKDSFGLFKSKRCSPWVEFKLNKEVTGRKDKWEFSGAHEQGFGPMTSVMCQWKKIETKYIKVLMTPIRLCWNECSNKFEMEIGDVYYDYDKDKNLVDFVTTPAIWIPSGNGVSAYYECHSGARSFFVPYPDDFPENLIGD